MFRTQQPAWRCQHKESGVYDSRHTHSNHRRRDYLKGRPLVRVSFLVLRGLQAGSEGKLRGITLTKDHLAIHASERTRIEKAGGVVSEGRLMGKTLISRSFGDTALKKV